MNRQRTTGFTIIELLVVLAIITLLFGILLPAIGKARDTALVNTSKSNLRQIGTALLTYAADWADRQVTYVRDDLGLYDGDVMAYSEAIYGPDAGGWNAHPPMVAGWAWDDGTKELKGIFVDRGNYPGFQPINFPGPPCEDWATGHGWYRTGIQRQPVHNYLNDRFHDPVYYAPKDRTILERIEPCFEVPGEYVYGASNGGLGPDDCMFWINYTSYCLSPAGLFDPQVFSKNRQGEYWTPPWTMPSGYRVPCFGQTRYPSLKTHVLEFRWLQNTKVPCNDSFTGCEPYWFNHSYQSMPVTLFYDGSVRLMSVLEAMSSDRRVDRQTGHGLWSRDTSFGTDGFFISDGYDFAETSFHILTIDGIRGRDTIGAE